MRDLVTALERASSTTPPQLGITAECRRGAPGVYVDGRKLASVGIRIRRGASYHGLALNVKLDLEPFRRINPCGYAGLADDAAGRAGGPATVGAARRGARAAPAAGARVRDWSSPPLRTDNAAASRPS